VKTKSNILNLSDFTFPFPIYPTYFHPACFQQREDNIFITSPQLLLVSPGEPPLEFAGEPSLWALPPLQPF
jgi:hypothetical protein